MIAILNSLSFRVHISVSSGLISGYFSFFSLVWRSNIMFDIAIASGSFFTSLCYLVTVTAYRHWVGVKSHVFWALCLLQDPRQWSQAGQVGGGALSCILSGVFSPCSHYLLSLVAGLIRSTPHHHQESFHPGKGLPFRLQGPSVILDVPMNEYPFFHSFSLRGLPLSQMAVFRRGSKVSSLPVLPPPRGAPASPPSVLWLRGSLWRFLCCVWMSHVGVWKTFSLYVGRERLWRKLTSPRCSRVIF